MLEAVGSVGGAGGSGAIRAVDSSVVASTTQAGSSDTTGVAPLSPRMRVDPSAGVVVMEYLNDSGEVTSQLPSEAVVAYLRSGLSVDGTPTDDGVPLVTTEA